MLADLSNDPRVVLILTGENMTLGHRHNCHNYVAKELAIRRFLFSTFSLAVTNIAMKFFVKLEIGLKTINNMMNWSVKIELV